MWVAAEGEPTCTHARTPPEPRWGGEAHTLRRRAASSTRRDALMAVGGERLTDLLFVLPTASPSSSSSFASERLGELGGDGEREQGGDERSGSRATDGDTGVSTGDRSARVGAEECSRRGPSSSSGS